MSKFKQLFTGPDSALMKGLCIALAIVILFSSGYTIGAFNSRTATVSNSEEDTTSAAPVTTAAPAPSAPATTAAPAPSETQAPAPSDNPSGSAQTTSAPAASETQAPASTDKPSAGAPQTKAEILATFTESANKIKTNAKKVTRNYEDLKHNEEHLQMPSLLKSVGSGLISKFLKKDETPVEYASSADIIANYPVKTQNYVINATEADLTDATCTDDGTNYNITLKFAECTDPQGTGCANAFNIITPEEIKEGSGGIVSESSVKYYDATITCKIDKATGNMISANYNLPMILSVKAMGINAAVGMTFEHDYTIEY